MPRATAENHSPARPGFVRISDGRPNSGLNPDKIIGGAFSRWPIGRGPRCGASPRSTGCASTARGPLADGDDVPVERTSQVLADAEAAGARTERQIDDWVTLVPAAIGNAVFDATGARLRDVPFTPARVAALRDAGSAR